MRTIAILSQKGGSGKTTVAIHLAVEAALTGKATLLFDHDPQESAVGWRATRTANGPEVLPLPVRRILEALATARTQRLAYAFLDTPPGTTADSLAAANAADLILAPCRATILDLRAFRTTAELVKLARKPAYAVINAAPVRASRIEADAREALAAYGMRVAPVVLHQRSAFVHSLTSGLTAREYEPEGAAAMEIAGLWHWVATKRS